MVAYNIQFGNGITLGSGIHAGNEPSFTITSSDISSPTVNWGFFSSYSTSGFTSDPGGAIYQPIEYTMTSGLESTIAAAFAANGLDPTLGYAWNVSWTTGGTGVIRLAINGDGALSLLMAPIDTTDTQWQSGSTNGPKQAGTFAFPATFTIYQPVTSMQSNNSWC
jgi:hypothetical protein